MFGGGSSSKFPSVAVWNEATLNYDGNAFSRLRSSLQFDSSEVAKMSFGLCSLHPFVNMLNKRYDAVVEVFHVECQTFQMNIIRITPEYRTKSDVYKGNGKLLKRFVS